MPKWTVGVSRVSRLVERVEIEVEAPTAEAASEQAWAKVNDSEDDSWADWQQHDVEVQDYSVGIPLPAIPGVWSLPAGQVLAADPELALAQLRRAGL
jgi:hypothetical protein